MIITIQVFVDANILESIIVSADSKVGDIIEKLGKECEEWAKTFSPVDTGTLRDSIQSWMLSQKTAEIAPREGFLNLKSGKEACEYAVYQEFGTYKMAAHPFLCPAVEKIAAKFADTSTWLPAIA